MRKLLWTLVFVPLATASLYACDHDDEEEPPAGYEDVVYQGDVTDEALIALVSALEQKSPADVPSQAPTLDMPAADAVLPKTPIPAFSWTIGPTAMRAPTLFSPRAASASYVAPLVELLGPMRVAHAHGTPYTGSATWLVFSTATNPKLVRVLSSTTTYTPSQEAWDAMVAAGEPITLTLVGVLFEENRIAMDGGPFQGSATTFTIAP